MLNDWSSPDPQIHNPARERRKWSVQRTGKVFMCLLSPWGGDEGFLAEVRCEPVVKGGWATDGWWARELSLPEARDHKSRAQMTAPITQVLPRKLSASSCGHRHGSMVQPREHRVCYQTLSS